MGGHTLSGAFSEELGHAVELAHDALLAAGDRHRVVEDGLVGVVAVAVMLGVALVQAEDVVDELLLLGRGLARAVRAGGGLGCA